MEDDACAQQLVFGGRDLHAKVGRFGCADQFQPISLLNVEGKVLFGVLARRMTKFFKENRHVNTLVSKRSKFHDCQGIWKYKNDMECYTGSKNGGEEVPCD